MQHIYHCLISCLLFVGTNLNAQSISLGKDKLEPVNVEWSVEKIAGIPAVKVVKAATIKAVDEPTFVKLKGINFKDGEIELKVLSRLLKDAPDYARGFIGIAFRINESNSAYESIYLRPLNARVDDQVRRSHSIQYYAYPDYKFDRLRKESPGQYEAYADMEMDSWITMRIVVKGAQVKLFLNDNTTPSLIVNDLKLGVGVSGGIGLWVDIGTEGYFGDLKISAY